MAAKKNVLVDTCVWIEYFRTASPISEELKNLIRNDLAVTTGVVVLELLQGIKKPADKELIKETILALPLLEATLECWILAGETGHALRQKGITLPATDLLLAAVAKKNACSIFTTDAHFKAIPELELYSD
jgi:predicted nucleic acid-binding protein